MNITLSPKIINFIETIYEKKKITRDDINIPFLSFYETSKYLRNNNLLTVNGVNEKNQHVLVLTPKGLKFAELIVQIKNLLDERGGK